MPLVLRLALLGFFLASSLLFGQSTLATLTGSVTDPKSLGIPNVAVEARNEATGYVYIAQTNALGFYTVGQLLPGPYVMRFRKEGFKEFVSRQIELLSRDVKTVDVQMEIGAVNTTVEVIGGAALIETETARVTQTATALQIKTLPVLARRWQEFMPLIPTVTVIGGQMHIAGSLYNNQNYWSLDGLQLTNFLSGSQPATAQNFIEGVAEVKVNAGNVTADQSGVAHITVISKAGTNQFHGSVFDYYSSSNWSARNPFAAGGVGSITHNMGVALGGPVYIPKLYNGKNRTFFFQTYERNFGGRPRDAMNVTVPLAPWRAGDFSGQAAVRDPLTSQPFPDNRIPTARLNPVALKIQDRFYPLPNFGNTAVFASQNYRDVLPRDFPLNFQSSTRVDHKITDKHYLFARFVYPHEIRGSQSSLPSIGLSSRDFRNILFTASENWVIRPSLLNEFRYGINYDNTPQRGPQNGLEVVKSLGLQGLAPNLPDIPGIFNMSFSGIAITGITQSAYTNPFQKVQLHQFHDTVSWFHGRHSVKAGAIVGYGTFAHYAAPASLFGNASFSNRFTGHPYADFLLGYPSTLARAFPRELQKRTRWGYDFFFADNIKVSRKLTLDLGVRYELHATWPESQKMASMFDVKSGRIVVPDGGLRKVSQFMPATYVGIVEAGSIGLDPIRILRPDKNNIAPRLGVAWRPFGNRTVFRGGFGVYYDVTPLNVPAAGVPFVIDEPAYTNPTTNPLVLPRVFPDVSIGGPGSISLPKGVRGDLRTPYSLQYTFSIEHERWGNAFHLTYIGTGLREGFYDVNVNQPVPDTRLFVNKPRPFPNYPAIRYTSNGAGHQYNGLVFKAERRFTKGLGYEYSFTWSRDLGDMNTAYAQDLPSLLENSFDRARDRSSVYDVPIRRHTGQLTYDLPVGRNQHFFPRVPKALDAVIGGWQLVGALTTHSGWLMTPMWTGTDPTGTAFTSSTTPAQVTIRADRLADGNLPKDSRTIQRWFDVGAFGAPQAGRFGTSGNSVLLGPPAFVLRAAIGKIFSLRENVRLHLALQSSNALNHPNYSPPGLTINQVGAAGVITSLGQSADTDQSGRRNVRVMVRLEW
jgi:hypothetical protein